MIIRRALGHGGPRVYYDRLRSCRTGERSRQYHAFGLCRVVNGTGESFWRLIIGQWTICWGYEDRHG